MRRAQVKDMISGRNENSEPVTCSRRARVSWRKSILTRDTPSVPREKAPPRARRYIGKINKPRCCIAVCRNGKRLIRPGALIDPPCWQIRNVSERMETVCPMASMVYGLCTRLRRGKSSKSHRASGENRLVSRRRNVRDEWSPSQATNQHPAITGYTYYGALSETSFPYIRVGSRLTNWDRWFVVDCVTYGWFIIDINLFSNVLSDKVLIDDKTLSISISEWKFSDNYIYDMRINW